MKKALLLFFFSLAVGRGKAQDTLSYRGDFRVFWTTIRDNYAYFDKKATDWDSVYRRYAPQADTVTTRSSFIALLERVFYELYDHHASLNTNLRSSAMLVPSGADLWAVFDGRRAVITEVRPGMRAAVGGIKAGMTVLQVNGLPVREALKPFLPKCLRHADTAAENFALRTLLAGNHRDLRELVLLNGRDTVRYRDQGLADWPSWPLADHRRYGGNTGYIRINNSLGSNDLMPLFDEALRALADTKTIILDLRETPSGGNTTQARAILGRFISKEGFYQKHELPGEERETGVKRSWVEIVSPRGPVYNGRLIVLCGRWTGSVSEGITIGFDALKRATVIGTRMAGLNGAIYSFTLPYSGIGYSFPAEKLFQVNGRPREDFRPQVNSGSGDALEMALKMAGAE